MYRGTAPVSDISSELKQDQLWPLQQVHCSSNCLLCLGLHPLPFTPTAFPRSLLTQISISECFSETLIYQTPQLPLTLFSNVIPNTKLLLSWQRQTSCWQLTFHLQLSRGRVAESTALCTPSTSALEQHPSRASQPAFWRTLPVAARTHQVRLLSKKRTRKSFSPASACFCSPSFSTSSGGTGMGTPLCRRPSRGILGSMIWKQRGEESARGGRGELCPLLRE